MAELVLSWVSIGIALTSILFVLWDHVFDDIVLSRRVQEHYEEIEKLIYSYYFKVGFKQVFDEMRSAIGATAITTREDARQVKENYSKHNISNWYAKDSVLSGSGELSKYLGLVSFGKKAFYYFSHSKRLLEEFGSLEEIYDDLFKNIHVDNKPLFSFGDLRKEGKLSEAVRHINEFLKDLRDYWNQTFKRRKPFRKKLKPKLDFTDIEKTFAISKKSDS
ncbi:MAG: hypothetical protein ACFFAS_03820 [Promethearchaeota archaeon]